MPKKGTKSTAGTVKGKSTIPKTPAKVAKATPDKDARKAKKVLIKKPRKPIPKITGDDFEKWFFKQSDAVFLRLVEQWNEKNLKIKIIKQKDYDSWLNYFKGIPASKLKALAFTGEEILPTEAYAAVARWHDIITHPARIDKIHQAGLTNPDKNAHDIVAAASKNDRYAVLCATRDKLAMKLEKGAGSRDTASLAHELTEIMTQIADYEKRQGPKRATMLGTLLAEMPNAPTGKRVRKKGTRNTSYAAKVTIDDVQGN